MSESLSADFPQAQLRRDIATPLYIQMEEILTSEIQAGRWKPGERIPSENELNNFFGVSRMTTRGVLNRLTDDGLLFRVPGKGTYVSTPKIDTFSPAYSGIREQLELMGIETQTRLIKAERTQASKSIADHLQIAPGEDVYLIRRLRFAKSTPISLHTSWVPADRAEGLIDRDTVNRQLCRVLWEDYGLRTSVTEEQLESTSLLGKEADLLQLEEGRPVLLLQDTLYDENDKPFEFTKIVFPGDRIRLKFRFTAGTKTRVSSRPELV